MHVGIDSVDIDRFKSVVLDKKLLFTIFTKSEINYCKQKSPSLAHYAVRFAAKEAFIKAYGFPEKIKLNEIEVINDISGKPIIQFLKKTHLKQESISISLTHTLKTATAIVIIE
jgi:holo-[acyl-carrier protein] synthase